MMNWEGIFKDDLKSNKQRLYALIIFSFFLLLFDNLHAFIKIENNSNFKPYLEIIISIVYWFVLVLATIFIFSKIIIPRYLVTRKYKLLISISVLTWIGIYSIALIMSYVYQYLLYPIICNCPEDGSVVTTVFLAHYYTFVVFIPLSIFLMAFYFMQAFYKEVVQQTRLIKEKTAFELNLIQRKVHPEFFLNSIKSLAERMDNGQELPKLVLLFSNILSFILYDSNAHKVILAKELEVVNDLIEFEKILHGRKFSLSVHVQDNLKNDELIPLTVVNPLVDFFVHTWAQTGNTDNMILYVDKVTSVVKLENGSEPTVTPSAGNYLSFENVKVV